MLCIAIAFMLAGKYNALFYVLGVNGQGPGPEATATIDGAATATIPAPGYGGVPVNIKDMGARFITVLTNPTNIGILIGLTTLAAGISLVSAGTLGGVTQNLTSFAALYFVPILMFFFFANMLIMPVDQYLQQANCPGQYTANTDYVTAQSCGSAQMPGAIYYPLLAIYNILGILALISFFKGGI